MPRLMRSTLLLICLPMVMIAGKAVGQTSPTGSASSQRSAASAPSPAAQAPATQPQPLQKPIDPGVADVNPLSASFRDMRVDLRQPTGFDNVYRVPGRNDLLMRSSGALYAVFPQSAYAQTARGPVPIIPAGTVFSIGPPPDASAKPSDNDQDVLPGQIVSRVQTWRESLRDSASDSAINSYAGDETTDANSAPVAPQEPLPRHMQRIVPDASALIGPTVANDESYRVRRIGELMAQAAHAARQPAN